MKTSTLDFDAQALREKILDLAMRGKLVAQDPNDEPASKLLEKIKAEKAELVKEKKIKKVRLYLRLRMMKSRLKFLIVGNGSG